MVPGLRVPHVSLRASGPWWASSCGSSQLLAGVKDSCTERDSDLFLLLLLTLFVAYVKKKLRCPLLSAPSWHIVSEGEAEVFLANVANDFRGCPPHAIRSVVCVRQRGPVNTDWPCSIPLKLRAARSVRSSTCEAAGIYICSGLPSGYLRVFSGGRIEDISVEAKHEQISTRKQNLVARPSESRPPLEF